MYRCSEHTSHRRGAQARRTAGGRTLAWLGGAVAVAIATGSMAADKPWAGLGRPASSQEIAAWDIDVKPDGSGLPPGRGTVQQGQEIYDAKCASCHGTFGESNQYLQLAGGIGTLAGDSPMRTTGSKLNYAPTLWDYINRAMPFQAPKSLTADEVYALTAYVLYLNEIVPEDAALDRESIVAVKLPNRDGFTTHHGFMRVDGKPDVQAQACMEDCPVEGRVVSSIPDHARNAHGNLAGQVRSVGPYRGADTSKPEPVGPLAAARHARTGVAGDGAKPRPSAADLAKQYACLACHGVDQKVVGPAFREVAKKYQGAAGARQALVKKVREGGSGVWGAIAMPGQPQIADADLLAIVEWVLAGAQ